MSIAAIARPEIRALRPYSAAAQVADTIRLNANEAPWTSRNDPFRRPLNRYPEIRPATLRTALAMQFGCAPGNLLVTRGSSEAIDLLVRCFCASGSHNIVTVAPTFSMYAHYARIQGAAVREIPADRDADFLVEPGQIAAACDADTRLVFLCTPNNPTGTSLPRSTLREVLASCRDRVAVVVDEAYIEFSGHASAVELLGEFDNLVILRTLSKALACAGARCGAAIAGDAVVDLLDAVQAPYALATPVVEYVETLLSGDRLETAEREIERIVFERERLASRLAELSGVRRVWPSDANFILASFDDADGVVALTRAAGILLRPFPPPLADCLRITVGSADENRRLLEILPDA